MSHLFVNWPILLLIHEKELDQKSLFVHTLYYCILWRQLNNKMSFLAIIWQIFNLFLTLRYHLASEHLEVRIQNNIFVKLYF